MPNYLGVDYGTKRIGLAWADELGIALPIGAFPGVDQPDWKNKIGKVIGEKKIDEIIVGYPIHMDGTVGVRAIEVDRFIAELENTFKLSVFRVDERLTSIAAEEGMGKRSAKKKKQDPGWVDASAAGLILSDFIENRKIIYPPES
jgi:putative Holliday junction resolvase